MQIKPKTLFILITFLLTFSFLAATPALAAPLASRVAGRILLQVEEHGKAWYVPPGSAARVYIQDGQTAFNILRTFGLGITNQDLAKIPVGIESRFQDTDSDGDGLPDKLEEALGTDVNNPDSDSDSYPDGVEVMNNYNPLGIGKMGLDYNLANRLKGRILLQIESRGQAWYVYPEDGKRYYLKDGQAAYQIMRYLSLGITNQDLEQIPITRAADLSSSQSPSPVPEAATSITVPAQPAATSQEKVVKFTLPIKIKEEWDLFTFEYMFLGSKPATLEVSIKAGEDVYKYYYMTTEALGFNHWWDSGFMEVDFLQGQDVEMIFELKSLYTGASIRIKNLTFYTQAGHGNQKPVADAGEDIIVSAGSDNQAEIVLDGSGSYDPDGDELLYWWLLDEQFLIDGVTPTIVLEPGVYNLQLLLRDPYDNMATDEVVVTVNP